MSARANSVILWLLAIVLFLALAWTLNLTAFNYWASGGPPVDHPEVYRARGKLFFAIACGLLLCFSLVALALVRRRKAHQREILASVTANEARQLVIEGINYAAYHETDYSLYDSDKNRLFGSEHYNSGRLITEASPWAEGDFEGKMAMLLVWANVLNRTVPEFMEAQRLLEGEDSILGRVIRGARNRKASDPMPEIKFSRR